LNWTVGALVLLAMVLANLPFLSERLFLVWPLRSANKHVSLRLLELLAYYLVTGMLAYAMESRMGPVHPQRWEFYATTVCLFLVFAYPGFVYRYLWPRRARRES
jgi:Protein of unknown function (DUF2818)